MKVRITKPDATLFEGDAKQLHLPGVGGRFEMLENHAPIISALTQGALRLVTPEGEEKVFDIRGGVIKGQRNDILILVQ